MKTTITKNLDEMKRKGVMSQTKGQDKTLETQLNKVEAGNLPEKEFRIMIVKMIKNLENKMEKIQESINKDLED